MSITQVSIKEFSAFTKLRLDFSPGINVIIGPNATGKSHLMKLLYVLHRVLELPAHLSPAKSKKHWMGELERGLFEIYRPDSLGRLAHRRVGTNDARVRMELEEADIQFHLASNEGLVSGERSSQVAGIKALFIPSREGFASFEGFAALYENRELSWDGTFYDLAKALALPALRGKRGAAVAELIEPLEKELGGKVVLDGSRFYVRGPAGDFEAPLLSEGLRKIATLVRLIANGSLQKHGVLFWDEPEANLNPRLARVVVAFLRTLAQRGIQIFVASHDALLCQRLSLAAEYKVPPVVPTRFIGLYRDASGTVMQESGNSLAELSQNAMLEEFTRYYEEERVAFEGGISRRKRK